MCFKHNLKQEDLIAINIFFFFCCKPSELLKNIYLCFFSWPGKKTIFSFFSLIMDRHYETAKNKVF